MALLCYSRGLGRYLERMTGTWPRNQRPAYVGLFHDLPRSHAQGPHFLNVLRVLDVPQALAMAAERAKVRIDGTPVEGFEFATRTAESLKWGDERLRFGAAH